MLGNNGLAGATEPLAGNEIVEEVTALRMATALESLSSMSACCGGGSTLPTTAQYFFGGQRLRSQESLYRWREEHVAGSQPRRHERPFVLPSVHVVNPGETVHICDVFVEHERITGIFPAGQERPESFAVLQGASGGWVMPGLIDMHVHLASDNILDLAPHYVRLLAAHGVTGARIAGDVDGTSISAVQRLRRETRLPVPRLCAAGPFVGRPPFRWKNSIAYSGPHDADSIVEQLLLNGQQCMKLYENLTAADIQVLQESATAAGMNVIGHVPTSLSLEQARILDAQHFFGVPPPSSLRRDHVVSRTGDWHAVDTRRLEEVVNACESHGLANTPTLVVTQGLLRYRDAASALDSVRKYMPSFFADVIWNPRTGLPAYRGLTPLDMAGLDDALAKKLQLTKELHARGCDLFLGTDTSQPFSVPGESLHREMQLFVEAGVPTVEVLRMATSAAAKRLKWDDVGRVEVGYQADLLVLERDPQVDLTALRTLQTVITRGSIYDVGALQRQLRDELEQRERLFSRLSSRVLAHIAMRQAAKNFTG